MSLQSQYDLALVAQQAGEAVRALLTTADGTYISDRRGHRTASNYTRMAEASFVNQL